MGKYTNLLSEEIKEKIESYIIEHKMKSGDILPSERILSEMFQVNRQTVRSALCRLRNEHHIYTEHGKGNFIAPPKIIEDTRHLDSFSSGWKKDGYITSSRVLHMEEREASLSVCRHLNLNLGEKVYFLQRIRYLDGEPTTLETSYLPAKLFPGLDQYDFVRSSLWQTLKNDYRVNLCRHEEQIMICYLQKHEAHYLNTLEKEPAFFIKGTSFDDDETPVEYCISINRSDRYVLTSKLTRQPE